MDEPTVVANNDDIFPGWPRVGNGRTVPALSVDSGLEITVMTHSLGLCVGEQTPVVAATELARHRDLTFDRVLGSGEEQRPITDE